MIIKHICPRRNRGAISSDSFVKKILSCVAFFMDGYVRSYVLIQARYLFDYVLFYGYNCPNSYLDLQLD